MMTRSTTASPTTTPPRQSHALLSNPDIRRSRLHTLALAAGIDPFRTPLAPLQPLPRSSVPADRATTLDCLRVIRAEVLRAKKPSLRRRATNIFRKKKENVFSAKEIHVALRSEVEGAADVATLTGLLEMLNEVGGDMNFSRLAKGGILGISRDAERSHLLEEVVRRGRDVAMVDMLARRADQESLGNGLGNALALGESGGASWREVVQVLLAHGADAARWEREFEDAVREGDLALVELMLRAPKPVGDLCVSRCLAGPGITRCLQEPGVELVSLLMRYRADGQYDNAGALMQAAAAGRADVCLVIALGPRLSSAASLDRAMGIVFNANAATLDVGRKVHLMEVLLCGGAAGDTVAATLVQCCLANLANAIELLVYHGASINYNNAEALRYAISHRHRKMVVSLLQGDLQEDCAASAFSAIDMNMPQEEICEVMRALLMRGAKGEAPNQALVHCVERGFLDAAAILVDHGASVDYDRASALRHVVSKGERQTLTVLLRGRPSRQSLTQAFSQIQGWRHSKEDRLTIAKALLAAGARGEEVDKALREAARETPLDAELIPALIDGGADTNFKKGSCLRGVIGQGDVNLLQVLLRGRPSSQSVSAAMQRAMEVREPSVRLNIVNLLLSHGAKGHNVAVALISTIDQLPDHAALYKVLLRQQDVVDYNEGQPVRKAASCPTLMALQTLMDLSSPNSGSITNAVEDVMKLPSSDSMKPQKLRVLLAKTKPLDSINNALVGEFYLNRRSGITKNSMDVLSVLLNSGASVNFRNGEPVSLAAQSKSLDALMLVLAGRPSTGTLSNALVTAWDITDHDWRFEAITHLLNARKGAAINRINEMLFKAVTEDACEQRMIRLLLEHGADPAHNKELGLHVVTRSDHITLGLLLEYLHDPKAISEAFLTAMRLGTWKTENGLRVTQLLLDKGVSGNVVRTTLAEAVKLHKQSPAKEFIMQLARCGVADINHNDGEALQLAAANADKWLLTTLLTMKPSTRSLSMAMPQLFQTAVAEETLLDLIALFANHGGEPLEFNFVQPKALPMLFYAVKLRPRWARTLQALLEAGYFVDQVISWDWDHKQPLEPVTLLLWALAQDTRVTTAMIDVLIKFGANVNYQAPISKKTALSIAVGSRRLVVVQWLLERGADAGVTDLEGISPLAYASHIGDQAIAQQLVQAGADVDDGSLHDAARELHVDVLRTLLASGHRPNFRSERHQGCSALGELCRNTANTNVFGKERLLKQAIELLFSSGTNPEQLTGERKSLLHLALDNPDPIPVTAALLRCFMGELVNKEFNIFMDSDKYCYSPTMYILKGPWLGSPAVRDQLITILRNMGCVDSYYIDDINIPQPVPPPGIILHLPQHIVVAERRRAQDLQDRNSIQTMHDLRLQLDREAEMQAQTIAHQRHRLDVTLLEERAQKTDEVAARSAMVVRQIENGKHQDAMRQNTELGNQRLEFQTQESAVARQIEDGKHHDVMRRNTELGNQRLEFQTQESAVARQIEDGKHHDVMRRNTELGNQRLGFQAQENAVAVKHQASIGMIERVHRRDLGQIEYEQKQRIATGEQKAIEARAQTEGWLLGQRKALVGEQSQLVKEQSRLASQLRSSPAISGNPEMAQIDSK